jgi:hypothetical protein
MLDARQRGKGALRREVQAAFDAFSSTRHAMLSTGILPVLDFAVLGPPITEADQPSMVEYLVSIRVAN